MRHNKTLGNNPARKHKSNPFKTALSVIAIGGMVAVSQLTGFITPAHTAEIPADTLNSIMWKDMAKTYLLTEGHENSKIVMDESILVHAPKSAEDQLNIPVHVDARAIKDVKKIIVLADLNPLPKVLTYMPEKAEARLSFRIKVEQGTPVRAAVLDGEGVWHVGGAYVDAAGGGCSQPAMAHGKPDWVSSLAEVRGRIWRQSGTDTARMRLSVRHPMDTGLADGIPAFFVSELKFRSRKGKHLGSLTIHEPISENPTLTVFPKLQDATDAVEVSGRDNEGNLIHVSIPAPVRSSLLTEKD
ncbi:MAG: hypothetical protein DHS20C08_02530 [Rhodomicrobium sp.]|nr:MAG: hypothetical protein DHS20C08_02530 [Rhodomicrobium sp.]